MNPSNNTSSTRKRKRSHSLDNEDIYASLMQRSDNSDY